MWIFYFIFCPFMLSLVKIGLKKRRIFRKLLTENNQKNARIERKNKRMKEETELSYK